MYPFLDYLSSFTLLYCRHQLCSSHAKLFPILPNTRIFHPLLRVPFLLVPNLSFNYSSFSVQFILNTYLNYLFLWEIFNGPFKQFYTIFVQSTTIPSSTQLYYFSTIQYCYYSRLFSPLLDCTGGDTLSSYFHLYLRNVSTS